MSLRGSTSDQSSRRSCRWFDDRLGLYLDGLLGARSLRRANEHLDECPDCRRRAAFMERCLAASRRAPRLEPGLDFEEAVWERILISRQVARRRSGWRLGSPDRRLAWWGGTLLAATAAAVLFLVLSPQPPDPGNPTGQLAERPVVRSGTSAPLATQPVLRDVVPPVIRRSPAEFPPEVELAAGGASVSSGARREWAATTRTAGAPVYGRLEPSAAGEEFSLDQVNRVPVPWAQDGRTYVVRQAVVARPGEGRVSF